MDENLPSKRYDPQIIDLNNKNSSQAVEINLIGSNKKILEIGTSTGYVTKILKDLGNKVTGIEIDQEAAIITQQYCEQMITGDVETLNLDEIITVASFDVILCGDVLEHLKKPETTLKKLRKFLKPDGYLVVSLPNFCHGDVLLNLLNGDFHYTSMGLLDETHLHFFGLKNIYSVFTDCGYQIKDLHTINLNVGTTELKIDETKIPEEILRFIRSLPNSTVYQFIFTAYPSENATLPDFAETNIDTLFFDSLKESRQELTSPLEEKIARLQERTSRMEELKQAAASGMEQMDEMTNTINSLQQVLCITSKDQQLEEVSVKAECLERQLSEKNSQLEEINNSTKTLAETLSLKDIQLQELTARLNDHEQKLSAIERSIIWQLTMKFHTKIIERLLPQNTFRRKYYDLGRDGGKILVNNGFQVFCQSVNQHFWKDNVQFTEYMRWIEKNEPHSNELKQLKEVSRNFSYRPKISIILPVWNIDKKWLTLALNSVINQIYDNWELCVVDGGSTKPHIKKILLKSLKRDHRIKVNFLSKNAGIAGNSNEALSLATGDFVGFLDHDDELAPNALYEIVKVLNKKQDFDLVYSDEDKLDVSGQRCDPFFKPDFSIDLLLSCMYTCHFSVYRKMIIDEIGGLRAGYEGSQDYDLVLRFIERTTPERIMHIPKILYHWRKIPGSIASEAAAKDCINVVSGKKALVDYLKRNHIEGTVEDGKWLSSYRVKRTIIGNPKVSIIIPTKDRLSLLKNCISSIKEKTTYKNYELIIINNGSIESETINYINSLNCKKIDYDGEFNFSKLNNIAVNQATGKYIIFLNNDIEILTNDWIESMLEHAQRTEVGAVGCKLLYPNGTIQHAGVVLGLSPEPKNKIAGHIFTKRNNIDHGYFGLVDTVRNYSAVTAAAMMVRKEVFEKVGGFDENLKVSYNDVDLCLKMRKMNYLIVYTPMVELHHHESASRIRRLNIAEVEYMITKWGDIFERDPYYNPNLSLKKTDCELNV